MYNYACNILLQEVARSRVQESRTNSKCVTRLVNLLQYVLLHVYDVYLMLLATRPLLRQIENLQSVHNAQTINWERVEESLSEKLGNFCSMILISTTCIASELLLNHLHMCLFS